MNYPSPGLLKSPWSVRTLPDPTLPRSQCYDVVASDGMLSSSSKTRPLFPHKPRKEDIKQGALGDCFLLGALISVLGTPQGPDLIEGMMKEERDAVVFRMYKMRTFEKVYFRVAKSIPKYKQPPASRQPQPPPRNDGPLWVSMLEKAYAAFVSDPGIGSYESLRAGRPEDALEVLFGVKAQGAGGTMTQASAPKYIVFGLLMQAGVDLAGVGIYKEALDEVFRAASATERLDWVNFITRRADAWEESVRNCNTVRHEDFVRFVGQYGAELGARTVETILRWMDEHHVLPGKRGTGVYSQDQLRLYEKIWNAVHNHQAVVAASNQDVGRDPLGRRGHSGGESMSKGLVGQHCYAILDAIGSGNQNMLRLGNPWGTYGRAYEVKRTWAKARNLGAAEMPIGEFWIDLSDLTKRFSRVSFGPEASAIMARVAAKR